MSFHPDAFLDDLVGMVVAGQPKPPLAQLRRAVEVAGDVATTTDDLVDHFVAGARRDGCSWADIGAILGVSRQGAQQRFGGPAGSGRECEHAEVPLTPRARRGLRQAAGEARRLGLSEVDTPHLLLALLRDPRGLAMKSLISMEVVPGEVEARLDMRPNASTCPGAPPRLSAGTLAVLRRASEEARGLGHKYVGTEHLLLGLFNEPGPARDVLMALGGTYEKARQYVLAVLEAPIPDVRRGRLKVARRVGQ